MLKSIKVYSFKKAPRFLYYWLFLIYHPNTPFYKQTVFLYIYINTLPPALMKEYKYTFVQWLILPESFW